MLSKFAIADVPPERLAALETIRLQLREKQRVLADWHGGPMAVSAVPGAGKSTGMAGAAAIVIATHQLHRHKQLLVVTFTRSAAAQIRNKIRQHLQLLKLPMGGFSVYTIHSLSLAIAHQHPDLSGIDEGIAILSDAEKRRLIAAACDRWIDDRPQIFQELLEGAGFDGEESERQRRVTVLRTEILPDLARTLIPESKSSDLSPQQLQTIAQLPLQNCHLPPEGEDWLLPQYPILDIAAQLYRNYEALRQERHRIDYDDMTRAALRVLSHPLVRKQWQQQIFAVFEDEAQDSSLQQQQLLEILASDPDSDRVNFVRVGDSNQAINSTFTPADPYFFRKFCDICRPQRRFHEMTEAGRSHPQIIAAANQLHRQANQLRAWGSSMPFRIQNIQPAPAGDPQPNANPDGPGVEVHFPPSIEAEAALIGDRIARLFRDRPKGNAAILVRYKSQVQFLYRQLKSAAHSAGFQLYDAGQSGRRSQVPAELLALVQWLNRPHSPQFLRSALEVLHGRSIITKLNYSRLSSIPEQFLYPGPLAPALDPSAVPAQKLCRSLLKASLELPPAALLTFLALALKYDANELATTDKLGDRLGRQLGLAPSLRQAVDALQEIVADADFSPLEVDADSLYTRPNQLTLITLHSAKGLDWDYVFLPFVHERTFPGDEQAFVPQGHRFIGNFNLTHVARAQLRAHLHNREIPDILTAQQQAHQLKGAEELRLLYVGMTRAKRLLHVSAAQEAPFTWSNLKNLSPQPPSPLLADLMTR